MYGPVSRVPESVSLGDHTIGGGRDPESGLIYIHTSIHVGYTHCMGSSKDRYKIGWALVIILIVSWPYIRMVKSRFHKGIFPYISQNHMQISKKLGYP